MLSMKWASCIFFFAAAASAVDLPNVVFICGESTDGRLLRAGSPIPLPNIELLKQAGVYFDTAYSNNPVCAPSRSSFWTGRATHKIPHMNNGFKVNGVWNNYEGGSSAGFQCSSASKQQIE